MTIVHDTAHNITEAIRALQRSIDEQKRLIHKAGLDRDFVKQEVARLHEELEKKEDDLRQKEIAIRRLEGDHVRSNRELADLERQLEDRNRAESAVRRELF